jgi:membrane-associated phospholipid phosphatase
MEAIWQWGLEIIRAIQQIHGPALDAFFRAVTFMGEEEFFLILLPLVFWCVDWIVGARLTILFLLSGYANSVLKELFAQPRPPDLDPSVRLSNATGYGLPSGHSQSAVIVWGYLAAILRKTWAWVAAIVLMVLIGFSRVYLGVHFPTDVLGGWALGAVLLAAYLALEPRVEVWLKKARLGVQLVLVVIVSLALLLVYPVKDATSAMAVLLGAGMGLALARRVARFSAAGPLWQRAVRFLVGLIGLLAIYFGLRVIFPGEGEPLYLVLRVVRYALLGLWMSLGAPWLFLRLRLASGSPQ